MERSCIYFVLLVWSFCSSNAYIIRKRPDPAARQTPTSFFFRPPFRLATTAKTASSINQQNTETETSADEEDGVIDSDDDDIPLSYLQKIQTQYPSLAHHLPYSCTICALRVFHETHGHLVLPYRYTVPANAGYPDEWVGYDLAGTVYEMKWWLSYVRNRTERVNELNSLGFVWDRLQPKWNLVVEALVQYRTLHNNVDVPFRFVVPNNSTDWPKAVWTLPLGNIVSRIRRRGDFIKRSFKRRQQLDRMGFVWNCREDKFWDFYNVLRYYLSLQETQYAVAILEIPRDYTVPRNDARWPSRYWGYPLGRRCNEVIHFQSYIKNNPEREELLRELGLRANQKPSDLKWFKVCHAAAIYSKLHRQEDRRLEVPISFYVPHHSDDWPEQLWGMPLGLRLQSIRLKGTYLNGPDAANRKKQLDALGFVWSDDDRDEEKFREFLLALTTYRKLYDTAVVPHKFVVPYNNDDWPAELGGYRLGYRAGRVRNAHTFIAGRSDRRDMLRALGFRMKPLRSDGGIALTKRRRESA